MTYQVRTAAKVPHYAVESDCCNAPPVLRVRVERGRMPIPRHVYIVCGDPEHWLWANNCCWGYIENVVDEDNDE